MCPTECFAEGTAERHHATQISGMNGDVQIGAVVAADVQIQTDPLTSFTLCCSLLHRNVPNKQLYRWSRMVIRKYSLNSNAVGNFKEEPENGLGF